MARMFTTPPPPPPSHPPSVPPQGADLCAQCRMTIPGRRVALQSTSWGTSSVQAIWLPTLGTRACAAGYILPPMLVPTVIGLQGHLISSECSPHTAAGDALSMRSSVSWSFALWACTCMLFKFANYCDMVSTFEQHCPCWARALAGVSSCYCSKVKFLPLLPRPVTCTGYRFTRWNKISWHCRPLPLNCKSELFWHLLNESRV